MTIVFTADVVCDRCHDWAHGVNQYDSADGMITSAREYVRRLTGWKRIRGPQGFYEDVCPRCLTEEEQRK